MTRLPVILAALICLGCGEAANVRSPSAGESHEPLVVTRGEFRDVVHLTGEVESSGGEVIRVPRIPNWQTSIRWLADDGSKVQPGQVVAELDSTQFSSGLEQKRLSLASADQSIAQQTARLAAETTQKEIDLEQKRVDLAKAVSKAQIPESILPLREYEENQLTRRRAEIEYAKAVTDLESQKRSGAAELANLHLEKAKARREIEIAEAAIDALTIRASTGGVLLVAQSPETGRRFQLGDTVWVGNEIATIPDSSALRIRSTLFDVDDRRIAPGMPVEIVVDAFPSRAVRGRLTWIGSVADPFGGESLRRGFPTRIELEGQRADVLRPGYSVRASVVREVRADALLVARAAVDFSEKSPRIRNRTGRTIEAKLGPCNALACVVESGLKEGDLVAVAGMGDAK